MTSSTGPAGRPGGGEERDDLGGLPCSGLVHGRIDCTHHDQIQWLRGVIAVQGEMIRDLERRLRGEPFALGVPMTDAPPPPPARP
jgi:hypothetical protein